MHHRGGAAGEYSAEDELMEFTRMAPKSCFTDGLTVVQVVCST
jgi:hypothetical protein